MADARPEPSAAGLGAINILAAGLPFGIYAAVLVEPDDAFGWYGLALRFVLGSGAFLGASLGTAGVFGILTWIEHRGVRFFGGRRGWRVTHAIATTVCAHAAIGWLVSGLLWSLGMVVSASGLVRPVVVRPAPNVVVIHEWVASLPPALGLLAGLLVFEVLVYTGIRRNRFANRERPDAVQLAGPS